MMRTIVIKIKTDSDDPIKNLKRDLLQEIGCCSAYFDTDSAVVEEERKGKWLPHPTEKDWDVCSVCGLGTHRRFHYNDAVYGGYDVEESFAFCPNCGARLLQ